MPEHKKTEMLSVIWKSESIWTESGIQSEDFSMEFVFHYTINWH